MEKYVETLRQYLGNRRHFTKKKFKMIGTIHRGISNNIFTIEEVLSKL